MIKVYSFDIFDTLLLRPYADPQYLWKELEERENVKGFAKARKKADAITFKKAIAANGETTIEEAYNLMPKYKHLMEKEFALEREVLRANPEMLSLWKELGKQGKRRVIVSDMYLPSDFIKSILCENGFDDFDGFYLSRDYNVRKSTGKLFQVMLHAENVDAKDVLHIGDNQDSDVEQPQKLGIQTQHYKKVITRLWDICPFLRYVDGRLSGTLALGWHQFTTKRTDCTYWHRLGFILAGVLGYVYVKWIVETAKSIGKNRLMFVARDGYVWKNICNEIFPQIDTHYFYAPRITSIAVNGMIGSDPNAVKDRQKYFDTYLRGEDLDKIKSDYQQYLQQFVFNEGTAMVDGCSSGFSAQKLVETIVGNEVFCFYLLAMAQKHYAASLYSTNLFPVQWQMLSEFLFGSPENPIKGVSANGPIYKQNIADQETFKISVSKEISEGAVACAKILHQENVKVSARDWLEYIDLFMEYLTKEDKEYLSMAQNATDVEQKHFGNITYIPYSRHTIWVARYKIQLRLKSHLWRLYLSRSGLHYHHQDISVQIEDVAMDNVNTK